MKSGRWKTKHGGKGLDRALLCTAGTNVARISKLAWDAEAKISTPYIPKDTTRILYVDDATVAIPGALWGEWRVIGGKILGPDQSEQTR